MIKKALLCNPPTGLYVREDRCQSSVDDFAVSFSRPPMDLLTAAAYLESAGVQVKVIDYPITKGTWSTYIDDLRSFHPDLLLISITTPTLSKDMKAASIAKNILGNGVLTCAKGAHFSDNDIQILNDYDELDMVFRGEDLCSIANVARGETIEKIPGITYKKKSLVLRNESADLIQDLDQLPMPALHLIDNSIYVRPDNNRATAHIDTNRGCPGRCIYCLVPNIHGRRIRSKSTDRVIEEIERCVHEFGISSFHFKADTFTWNKKWVLDLCRKIIGRKLKIEWFCNSRVDTIDEERLVAMKQAGCFAIGFGIESGSQMILDKIKKGTTLNQCCDAINLTKKHGIQVYSYFMIGFPWDTISTVQETIDFACQLKSDFMDIFIAYPFPGTDFESIVKKEGLLLGGGVDGRAYSQAELKTRHLSAEELVKMRKQGLIRFYTRPSYVVRKIWTTRSPLTIYNYIRHGMKLILNLMKR